MLNYQRVTLSLERETATIIRHHPAVLTNLPKATDHLWTRELAFGAYKELGE